MDAIWISLRSSAVTVRFRQRPLRRTTMTYEEVATKMLFGGRVDYRGAVYHVIAVNRLTGTVKISKEYEDQELKTVPIRDISEHVFKENGKN